MKKIVEEANTMITEIEGTILTASIDNQTMNATNITQISKDLQFMVQSNIEQWAFQVQRILTNELDRYRGKEKCYINDNIQEIQQLYIDEESQRKKLGKIKEDEVILIKPYEVSESILTKSLSFINEEIDNLIKYMKFVKAPTQTRIFRPPPYYQSLQSRGEQDSDFWKEITIALVDNKYNTETSRNRYPIWIFQGGPPHKLFFITIDNRGQVIISPNKKTVVVYMIGELEVLVWFIGIWKLKMGYCYDQYLKVVAWRRA